MTIQESISLAELVRLAAVDNELFGRTFFPKAIRQTSPPFHRLMDSYLDNPLYRYVAFECFRDSAKTTKLRVFTAKRIAYGISRTILYVGANDGHAVRSVTWLRQQVEKNRLFADTFGLQPGRKWQENEAEIYRKTEDAVAWILGVGINSNSLRGINFDDFRPDLIILDDPISDENALTLESREKISNLIHGAIKGSLAPRSEMPNAKMAFLQTPIFQDDALAQVKRDPEWKTLTISCWTPETESLPIPFQESSWPERYSSEERRSQKEAAITANKYSVFAREYECKLITSENAAFRTEWIRDFDGKSLEIPGTTIIIIDPVPPPSPRELAKGLHGKDYEAIIVLRRSRGAYYVLDYRRNRGHEPNWTVASTIELASQYRPHRIIVEAVAYQRVLEYLLRQEMQRRGIYWAVVPITDKRKKYNRIVSTLAGPLSQAKFFVRSHMSELKAEITMYPNTSNDDLLDACALGVMNLSNTTVDLTEDEYMEIDESGIPDLRPALRCP